MNLDPDFVLHVIEAIGLGLAVAVILYALRRFAAVRRVQLSALLGVGMLGVYLIINRPDLPGGETLARLALALAIMLLANVGVQLFDVLVWENLLSRQRHLSVPRLLIDLFNFVALIVAAVVVLDRVFNADLSAFLVTSTVISAVIGLSLQDILGNVVAGLALQIEQPFRAGDWVKANGQEGRVIQLNWRTLTILTRDNHYVILPNANVAKQELINYSRPVPRQRLHVQVGVAYQHAPGEVKVALARAAADVEGVLSDPVPEVTAINFGDFAVNYDVHFWIEDYARTEQLLDAVLTRIWYELRRTNLTIPYPTREVKLHTIAADQSARVGEQLQQEIFKALRPLPLFAPLADAQIERLACCADMQRYTRGEVLVRQGEAGDSLFVIRSGRVSVDMKSESGHVVTVATLGPGEFFGEMSLLTGESRSASVVAQLETEVVVVDKPDFAEVLLPDSNIVEALSAILAMRARQSAEQIAIGVEGQSNKVPSPQPALRDRIKVFFGVG